MWEFECEREYLPSIGQAFGFRIGRITVAGYGEGPLGFVEIDERGPMYAAGFRAGDIPLAGVDVAGMMEFCGLLRGASDQEARIVVTTSEHWPVPEPQRRELVVPRPPKRR
jgi:hypothetical protein